MASFGGGVLRGAIRCAFGVPSCFLLPWFVSSLLGFWLRWCACRGCAAARDAGRYGIVRPADPFALTHNQSRTLRLPWSSLPRTPCPPPCFLSLPLASSRFFSLLLASSRFLSLPLVWSTPSRLTTPPPALIVACRCRASAQAPASLPWRRPWPRVGAWRAPGPRAA